jgi:cyanate lyase
VRQKTRLAISRAKRSTSDLVAAAAEHGYTLRELARTLGVSHVFLSLVGSGKRKLPESLREQVARTIGWLPD